MEREVGPNQGLFAPIASCLLSDLRITVLDCVIHMVCCLHSTFAVDHRLSLGCVTNSSSHTQSIRTHLVSNVVTGRLRLHARAPIATTWQCQFSSPRSWKVCASSQGFGQKSDSQLKSNKRDSTALKTSIPEKQSQKPQRPQQAQQTPNDDEDKPEEVPEIVNDRMLKRIIAFCGIPVFTGFLLYPLFYYLKVTQHVDLPMSVVYIVQLLTFGGGFFGITYGILSASWDPRREGSLLGITEFKANLPLILDRVKSRGGKGRV